MVTVTATSSDALPESTDVTLTASNVYSYGDDLYELYTFDDPTEEQATQYNSVKTLLEDQYNGELSGNFQVVNVNAVNAAGESVTFPNDTTFDIKIEASLIPTVTKAYVYDGDALEETKVTFQPDETGLSYPYAFVTVNTLQPIVLVDTSNLTENVKQNSVDYTYGEDHTSVKLTANSKESLPDSKDITVTASNVYNYAGDLYELYTFADPTEEQTAQYNSVEALLKEKYTGDLVGNFQVININAADSNGEAAAFPSDTVYNAQVEASLISTVTKAYVYDGDKLVETEVTFTPDETGLSYSYAFVTVNALQPIVLVDTSNLTENVKQNSVDYTYGEDHTSVKLTANSKESLPDSKDITVTASNVYNYAGDLYELYTFADPTEEQTAQYNSVEALLKEKYTGGLASNFQVININAADSNGEAAAFPSDTVYNAQVEASLISTVTKAYVYDGDKLVETEVTFTPDETGLSYSYAFVTVNALHPIVLVNTTDLTDKNDNDDDSTGLKPGAYTITANMYVDGPDNVVLKDVTAYLTNPNVPPLEPMKNNAKLYVTEDHQVELTIKNLNTVFTLQDIKDIEGKVEIKNRIMEEGDFVKYNSRISGLVMKLKDLSGNYKFEDCTEYPVILEEDKHMPICLSVDFSSMKPGFDDNAANITSKEFSFADGKAVISTSETTVASAVENAQFSVEDAANTQELKTAVETLYSADKKYKVYNPQLINADESVSLTGNSQIAYTIQTDYENAKVYALNNGELEELDSVYLNGKIVFSDTKAEPFAIIDNALAGKTVSIKYESDDISYGYYMVTDEDKNENALSGDQALQPRVVSTNNGIAYYIGFKEGLTAGQFSYFSKEHSTVKVTIPYDSTKKIYLVRQVNEKVSENAEVTGFYDTVTEVDLSNAVFENGKVTFNLLEQNVTSSALGSAVMAALYDGLKETANSVGTAYILVSDKKIAGMPENPKRSDGTVLEDMYSGRAITLPTGSHYKVTAGQDNAVDVGEYTCTVVPENGYTWLNGGTDPVTINWSIRKNYVYCKYVDETIKVGEKPAAKIEYSGFVNGETTETAKNFVKPTVTIPDNLEAGKEYKITPVGGSADSYNVICYEGTLKVRDSSTVINPDKDKTETVTANLFVPGELNKQLPGVTAYLTNGNNPSGEGGYEKKAPTEPVYDNAKLTTHSDGTRTLVLEVPNPVFTLQKLDGEPEGVTVSDADTKTTTCKAAPNGTRISEVTIELPAKGDTFVFTDCEEYPTLLGTMWDVNLTLKLGKSGLDSKTDVDTGSVGGGTTVVKADVTVKVKDDTATVSKINTDDLSSKNSITLDVTDGNKGVTGVNLPVSALEKIVDAKVPGTTLTLSDTSAKFDLAALTEVTKAASGKTVDLRILTGSDAEKKFSATEKSAMSDVKNASAVSVALSSDDKAITSVGSGKLTVSVPYKWDGKGAVRAYQVDANGKLVSVPVTCKNNVAELTLTGTGNFILGTVDTKSFDDVADDAFYKTAVDWAVENGVTSGVSDTLFAPDKTCTRAQVVTFLWRAAGSPEPTGTENPFTDVKSDAYYYKAVLWALEKGITSGTSATTFAPEAVVSRAQVVTFQWRMAGSPKATGTNNFTDVPADSYYKDAVQWAAENGITSGTSATTFAPNTGCTRGQIVTFLYRQLGK